MRSSTPTRPRRKSQNRHAVDDLYHGRQMEHVPRDPGRLAVPNRLSGHLQSPADRHEREPDDGRTPPCAVCWPVEAREAGEEPMRSRMQGGSVARPRGSDAALRVRDVGAPAARPLRLRRPGPGTPTRQGSGRGLCRRRPANGGVIEWTRGPLGAPTRADTSGRWAAVDPRTAGSVGPGQGRR